MGLFWDKSIDKTDFYKSKYEFYKTLSFGIVIIACLASTTYFVSDCQLFGRFAIETLAPRMIILVPMLIFILVRNKIKDYRVLIVLSYVMVHLIMWNTIWAIYYLPDRTHASEGFIIMHLMFMSMGFCAPFKYSTIAHVLVIANILISNCFNHYENLDIMLSLGIPCVLATCALHYVMERFYETNYLNVKKLQEMSFYDPLTGCYNRNVINNITDGKHKKLNSEFGKDVSILMFDIDFFKKVNDTYGHFAGDEVLKSTVKLSKSMLESKDYLIRWGGEEFVIILADTGIEDAMNFAENLRKKAEQSDNGVCKITISIGVSSYNNENYKECIDNADQALYNAKNSGRNCVKLAD